MFVRMPSFSGNFSVELITNVEELNVTIVQVQCEFKCPESGHASSRKMSYKIKKCKILEIYHL
jgi:hypothetical protein